MRKLSAGFVFLVCLGVSHPQAAGLFCSPVAAQEANAEASVREDAELLYGEAIDFKKKGNLAQAIDSYGRAMRLDRSILAFDDFGLIEALKNDCQERLKTTPEDVKLLETLGFVYAVCYSDYEQAIACYEKVFQLVTDEKVREKTAAVIERLRESAKVQENFHAEVSAQLRDERLKSWSELEKQERFGEETAQLQEKSAQLAESYKNKDALKNRVPQIEKELKDLQDEYDKANRLFYSVADNDLYERRRRRLKDQIAEKEKELADARSELEEVESMTSSLESEINEAQKAKEESPIRSYEDSTADQNSDSESAPQSNPEVPAAPPSNDFGSPDGQDNGGSPATEPPLPASGNPDFPVDPAGGGEGSEPLSTDKIDELIDNI